jgi:hypothetical protein
MPVLNFNSTKGWIPLKLSFSLLTPFSKGVLNISQQTALPLRGYHSCQQTDNNMNTSFGIPVYTYRQMYRLYHMILSDSLLP